MARRERRLTKRERKAVHASATTLDDRVRAFAAESGIPDERIYLGGSDGRPKMSEVLTEWAAPILDNQRGNLIEFKNAVKFATVLWNMATMSRDPAEVVANQLLEAALAAGVPYSADMHAILVDLVASRRAVYGEDSRVVIDTEVLQGEREYRLEVAASYLSPPA